MSEALKYLMQIRPKEMADYFSFLKNSGSHLDDKTRAIISVITKVDKQTASGFRQYLNKALNIGVTANEIIDALFVAFPTLGLSKIVWAIDILLEMNIAEFDPQHMQAEPAWHDVIKVDELDPGVSFVVDENGKDLFVSRENDEISVYDNRCPHQSTLMNESGLCGYELTCPLHNWKFDLRTGKCVDIGNKSLKLLQSKLENGILKVLR